jgi:hypothetical protein
MGNFLFVRIRIQPIAISVSQILLVADPFWLQKITTDPHIHIHVHTECPDDRYIKFKIYISELTMDN